MILNISADHLERHRNLKNYVDAKLKLLYSQKKRSIAYVKKNDVLISKNIKSKKLKCKVIEVGTKINDNFLKKN